MKKLSRIREVLWKVGKNRIFLFIIFILILTGLCIYYVENYTQHQVYPSEADVVSHYPEGKLVSVSGTVTQVFPGGFVMKSYDQNIILEFRVYSAEDVSPKDNVAVLGVLLPNYQIISQKMLIATLSSFRFVLIRSFLAFLVLFLIFNHYWKFNWNEWMFKRRK